MKFPGEKYYKLCRRLLSLSGFRLNYSSWVHKCQIAFCWTILTTVTITQLLVLTAKDFTIDDALDISPILFTSLTFVMKYNTFLLGFKNVKILLEKIERDWHDIKDQEELRILTECSNTGRTFVVLFCCKEDTSTSICIYPTTISFALSPFISPLLDLVIPLNESRPVFRIVESVYFFDTEKHFLLVAVHQSLFSLIGSTIVIGTESVFLLMTQHTRAIFKITCYRIRNSLGHYSTGKSTFKDAKAIRKGLIAAAEMHKRAISWIMDVAAVFERSYFYLLIMAIIAMSCNIYSVYIIISRMADVKQVLTQVFFLITQFMYLFILNWLPQRIIDHSAMVFDEIYDTQWYETPLHIQKLVLFMMKRSLKGTVVLLGGIYCPSMEGFSLFCSSSLSYFMMLYSTRAPNM